jgi:hypothetical protein
LAKYIGYDPARSVADLLDSCFFKQSEVEGSNETSAFELSLIEAGKSLGSFAIGVGGMDVVLSDGSYMHNFDNGDFKFDLTYARSNNVTISVASGTAWEKKIKKEQCLQFLDIAAFYGFFVKEGKVTSTNNGVVTEKKGHQIYTDLLSPFATKNKWYFYIRSDRTRSYNFYDNYPISSAGPNNLKMGLQENILVESIFGTNAWPLLINTQQAAPVAGNGNKNNLFVQFVTDNNVNTMLYGQIGTVENAQQNNFCNADGLVLPADAQGNPSRLTKIIQLSNPAVVESNQSKNIAGFTLLHYRGVRYPYKAGEVVNENNEIIPVYAEANFFDDVFDLIDSKTLFKNSENSLFSKMTSERLSLVNHYFNRTQQGISAVQTVTINDSIATGVEATPHLQRVTYVTEAVDVMNNPLAVSGSISSNTKTAPASSGNAGTGNLFQLEAPYFYEIKVFTDSAKTISGLLLKTLDGSVPNKILLGITKAENEALKTIISSTPGIKNPRIFLIDLFEDGNELISPENIAYQKYKVGLVMKNTLGLLELKMPASDIMVYSLDRCYHFSEVYSKYAQYNPIVQLSLDLEISL